MKILLTGTAGVCYSLENPHTYADVSGLINDSGYKPDTDLKDGISEFVKWYKKFILGDK